jgi:hypothetical protein
MKATRSKNISRLALAACITLSASVFAFGQSALVTAKLTETVSAANFNRRMNEVYGTNAPQPLNGPLSLYRVTYRSTDAKGRNAILSGLVAFPNQGAPKGIVVFNHGTTVYNEHMPSRYKSSTKGTEPDTAVLAFSSGGYALVMPDYIGQGDHTGGHPYPANVVNAKAGIDLVKPARDLMNRIKVSHGNGLYITGYSEGGGVAMAQVREIEKLRDPAMEISAAAPASGPYDLSGVTVDFMLEQPTDQFGFVVRTYLLGDLVYYLHKSQGVKITNYFKPSMAFTINNAYGGRVKDEDIVKRIGVTAVLMRAKNSIFNVVTPRFKKVMETMDLKDPAARLLKDNDCYDWTPRTKMLLINLEGDTVVTPRNSEKAFETIRRRGVGANMLRRSIIVNPELNHITAVPTALLRARNFFDNGYNGVEN